MTPRLHLTGAQLDRAAGALLATACGDALGAGYEFGPPLAPSAPVGMVGGGGFGWEPGEWTDDTSMALAIAQVAADGTDLRTTAALDDLACRWVAWAGEAKDVGVQTRAVLTAAARATGGPTGAGLATAARRRHERTGRSGGNGSLMRTAPVALAYLHDVDELAAAARAISDLTHPDPDAGDACVLWCLAIRHAVLHACFDGLRAAVDHLPPDRRPLWHARLDEAQQHEPEHFAHNGWVVHALQAAWSAITHTPVPGDGTHDDPAAADAVPARQLQAALERAVRAGHDTDTVAAIAGGLLGARWGASAVPVAWRRAVHGWPGLHARNLIRLAVLVARHGRPDRQGWPTVPVVDYTDWSGTAAHAVHPHDPGVHLGGIQALRALPDGVDAVVSLCRLGAAEAPAAGVQPGDHVEMWLSDRTDPHANPNLGYVLTEAADAVAQLRAEGRTVLLHCVQAQSRTPTIAALYAARHLGVPLDQAVHDLREVLPYAQPNERFLQHLHHLATADPELKARRTATPRPSVQPRQPGDAPAPDPSGEPTDGGAHYSDRVGWALAYAARLHAGQTRKGKTEPYLSHVLAVTALVVRYGGSEDQIIAAALHDAAEDCGGEPRLTEIRHLFGDAVADIVRDCSDSLSHDPTAKAPWRDRKIAHLKHAQTISANSALVALCDKIDNLTDLVRDVEADGERTFARFNGRASGTRAYYTAMHAVLAGRVAHPAAAHLAEVLPRIGADVLDPSSDPVEWFSAGTDR